MPTKKELQQKNNDLEKLVKEKEGNFNDFVGFIKTLNLWDIFVKTMKTDILVIDEVKYAINSVCPCCNENEKEKEIAKLKKELENEKQDFAKFQSGALEYDIQWYQCDKCNKYKFDGYENSIDTEYGEICVECYKEHYENK